MKNLKWGFIGCGDVVVRKSGPAFSEVEGSSVVAVMSRHEQRVRTYAINHGVAKWYTDAQQLIDDPDVNAVYVATPPSSHATFATMAMKAGKPVYVEKPLAASYEDCARINSISERTGVPCFVAYYRRYLPYFLKVMQMVKDGLVGRVLTVQVRFATPPRELDYGHPENLPWRLQPDIAGGGYFYDMAPHQLQTMFGVILDAEGVSTNRANLYKAEDTVSACFRFENGLSGSGMWCFAAHESASEDCIEIIGDQGKIIFSVFNYAPIQLHTTEGVQHIVVPNPPYVQFPIVKAVVEHLQGLSVCTCTSVSATPVNWAMDRILGKI